MGPSRVALPLRAGIDGTVAVAVRRVGRQMAVVARTASDRRRGALAKCDGDSLAEAARTALRLRVPLIVELASSGADVSDGVDALHGWGGAAAAVSACSGHIPVVAVATGPVISGPALLLGLADLVVMTADAVAFVSGPEMVSEFTGVRVGLNQLGGQRRARSQRVASVRSKMTARWSPSRTSFPTFPRTPTNSHRSGPLPTRPIGTRPSLREVVPTRANAAYDVRDVVGAVVDDQEVLELWTRWAPQVVTLFAHLGGRSIGVIANQPRVLAGTLDIAASQKEARFVRLCDAFNLPIVTFVDTPGFLPGKDLEWRGMIRHGAELAFAYAEATVPRLSIIVRKAFGGAYIVMDSKGLGNDLCFAWPSAEVAVMGARGAVQILFRQADDAERSALEDTYTEEYLSPWSAAERGFVDGVIDPGDTRSVLAAGLEILITKKEALVGRKHDAGPL